jgi:hypothetical protein
MRERMTEMHRGSRRIRFKIDKQKKKTPAKRPAEKKTVDRLRIGIIFLCIIELPMRVYIKYI